MRALRSESRRRLQYKGFTLIEVMIVLVLLAILVLYALPGYRQQITKSKRVIARSELLTVVARQEQFFINHKRYAATLDSLGYIANPYSINSRGEDVVTTSADRVYTIRLNVLSPQSYEVQAVPQLTQINDTACGTLQLSSLGVKSAGGTQPTTCW